MFHCEEPACKTNDPNSFIYCPKCLIINFPRLNIEDIYEMYAGVIECIEDLAKQDPEFEIFDVLTPGELKEEAFEMYNKLMLIKQEKEENDG